MYEIDKVIVASTLHEPFNRLDDLIHQAIPFIKKNFDKIIVYCSPSTNEDTIAYLKGSNLIVQFAKTNSIVKTYKECIKKAIEYITDSEEQYILYIDFDRFLHWVIKYPEELLSIFKTEGNLELLHLGRSTRAFETHPKTQILTENIVNLYGSQALGFKNNIDLISVCFIFSKRLAQLLVNMENKTETGFYGTWPILLWSNAKSQKYREVEGLEWETPDRFKKEIGNTENSYKNWLDEFQSSDEWKRRVNLLNDCLLELSEILNITLK